MSYSYEDDLQRRKRYAIISISSILLISMVVAVTVGVSRNNNDGVGGDAEVTSSAKAIKEICAPTDYRKTCEESLMASGRNSSDPMELVMTVLNVTMNQISDAVNKSQTLIELQKDNKTKMALDQCKELMHYAIDELESSFAELGKFEFNKIDEALINLKIWLSAAISHESTCLEGFEETEGNAGETMKKALKTAVQLTHSGLAIVNEMSSFISQLQIPGLNSRRLLWSGGSGELPSWLDSRARRHLTSSDVRADIVVAKDGSGQYTTINEALEQIPKNKNTTFVVHIKAGLYEEYVQVNKSMTHVMFIGDGADRTRISGSKGYTDGITTFRTASAAIVGDGFIAKNIGFENTAGAIKHQAVALRVQSDLSIFYNCSMDGYQDTLYAHTHRQFYRDCKISGTIDFVFGDAAAVFQNCTLVVRKPLSNQMCPITANGRQDPHESTGFVFQGCTITGEPDYLAVKNTSKAYLGRPWKEHSRTIIMNTFIPDFVQPEGWQPWNGDFGLNTLFYSEVQNNGPGANLAKRVTWPGIKTLTDEEILEFTPAEFIQGDTWIPGTGVPYNGGMLAVMHSDSMAPTAATGSTVPPPAGSPIPSTTGATTPISSAAEASVDGSNGSDMGPSASFSTFADTSGKIAPSSSSNPPSPSPTAPSPTAPSPTTPSPTPPSPSILASASSSISNAGSSLYSYASRFFGGSSKSSVSAPVAPAQAPAMSGESVSSPIPSPSTTPSPSDLATSSASTLSAKSFLFSYASNLFGGSKSRESSRAARTNNRVG